MEGMLRSTLSPLHASARRIKSWSPLTVLFICDHGGGVTVSAGILSNKFIFTFSVQPQAKGGTFASSKMTLLSHDSPTERQGHRRPARL